MKSPHETTDTILDLLFLSTQSYIRKLRASKQIQAFTLQNKTLQKFQGNVQSHAKCGHTGTYGLHYNVKMMALDLFSGHRLCPKRNIHFEVHVNPKLKVKLGHPKS